MVHKVESIPENKAPKILWEFEIQIFDEKTEATIAIKQEKTYLLDSDILRILSN